VECKIFVNRNELTELYPFVQEVRVDFRRGSAATCTVVLDSLRTEAGQWTVQDAHAQIRPLADLAINATFGGLAESVMTGLIKEVRMEFPQEMSGAKVTITGQDYSLLLDRERIDEKFPKEDGKSATDGDLVAYLVDKAQLAAKTTERGLTLSAFPINDTAIQILKKRAAANGFELYVKDKTVHFHPPALDGEPQPPILVYAGKDTNCMSIDVRHDGHQPDQVSIAYAARKGTEAQIFTASPDNVGLGPDPAAFVPSGQAPSVWRLESTNSASEEELKARAQAAANERAFRISAEGDLDGALYGQVLRSMETVTVQGLGSAYSGKYYVADVSHTFTTDGYKQHFKLLRNQMGEERELAAATAVVSRTRDARARQ
jgi:phage protein D